MKKNALFAGFVVSLLCGAALHAQDAPQPPDKPAQFAVRIQLVSVLVDDQEKALKFYTEFLGFQKKQDVPVGEHRWLTLVSPQDPDGPELLLEPVGLPAAKTYQKALYDAGIPLTALAVNDVQAAHETMAKQGVKFRTKPTDIGPTTIAVFDDTCGNLIQLFQK